MSTDTLDLSNFTAVDLAEIIGTDVATAERLLVVATAMADKYSACAPAPIRREAIIRFCGYLAEAGSGAVMSLDLGGLKQAEVTNHASAFRNCGAAALLSPWKIRRAGTIG